MFCKKECHYIYEIKETAHINSIRKYVSRKINMMNILKGFICGLILKNNYVKDVIILNQSAKLKLNIETVGLEEYEIILYELFINNTLQNIELIGTKQLVRTNINMIYEYILKNTANNSYIEDITQLYNRANEIDFDMNIDKIHSDVLKNLFVTYVKFENLKEFQLFLEEKKYSKEFSCI